MFACITKERLSQDYWGWPAVVPGPLPLIARPQKSKATCSASLIKTIHVYVFFFTVKDNTLCSK